MRTAFKEWAVVVDALGRGDQILILRKGGIHEGRAGFQVEHPEFLLFPTAYHQQREFVTAPAQQRYDQMSPSISPDRLRIEFFGRVIEWQRLDSLAQVQRLNGQHVWKEEVLAQRLDWGRDKLLFALAVRVFRLPVATELPMLSVYGGCKSWVDLSNDLETGDSRPVLSDAEFSKKLQQFQTALAMQPAA